MRAAHLLLTAVFMLALAATQAMASPDWSGVKKHQLLLFYPGVTSWEFLTGDDHRLGGREIKKGKKECVHCHLGKGGELDLKTDEIASGAIRMKRSHNPFEPEPLSGKKGTMRASVQAAYDKAFLYIRVEWDSRGAAWAKKGATPDRASLQLNAAEPAFEKYGCFITCHNDLSTMPDAPSKAAIEARGGRDDVSLYAYYARESWSQRKAGAEARMKTGLIDLKAVEFEGGRAVARDGWIFDERGWEDGNAEGSGAWEGGRYSAVFMIRLGAHEGRDVAVSEGGLVNAGLAIHEEGASKRKHYVSFPLSIGIGKGGDVQAVKLP